MEISKQEPCADCNKEFHPAPPAQDQSTSLAKFGVVTNTCPDCGKVDDIPSFAMANLASTSHKCLACREK